MRKSKSLDGKLHILHCQNTYCTCSVVVVCHNLFSRVSRLWCISLLSRCCRWWRYRCRISNCRRRCCRRSGCHGDRWWRRWGRWYGGTWCHRQRCCNPSIAKASHKPYMQHYQMPSVFHFIERRLLTSSTNIEQRFEHSHVLSSVFLVHTRLGGCPTGCEQQLTQIPAWIKTWVHQVGLYCHNYSTMVLIFHLRCYQVKLLSPYYILQITLENCENELITCYL